MNQTQIKYVRNRAEQLLKEKKEQARVRHTSEGRTLSNTEKLQALRDGAFTVDETNKRSGWSNWYYNVKFNDEVQSVVDFKAIEADEIKLTTAYHKLMDELILGDNEEAMKLLSAFESM